MNKIKFILDITMTILMVLLMKTEPLGMQIHEIIGIIIFLLFFIHKIVNYKFVKAIGKNFFNKKIKINSKIIFILDIILLCFMLANALTGIFISKYIFAGIMITNAELITVLHKFFAWWTFLLISIHIGLHLEKLVHYFTGKYKILKNNTVLKAMILIIYCIFVILGIGSLCKYSIYSKIIPIIHNDNPTQITQEKNHKNKKDNSVERITTLEEYLSQFYCGECRKNCSLLYPKCEVGKEKREEKIQEYNKIYGSQNENGNNLNNNEIKNNESMMYIKDQDNDPGKGRNRSNVLDVVNVMIFFSGGTYYIYELLKNKSKK